MKIEFPDKSYVECQKSSHPGKITLTVAAKASDNPLKRIINTVEMTTEQFKSLISDV